MNTKSHRSPGDVSLCNVPEAARDTLAARQNEPWSLRLLAAQRQLYSEGKGWQKVRSWSVASMAAIGLVGALFAPSLLPVTGILGAVSAVAQWVASQIVKQRTKTAAAVQELFDTTVFALPWNINLVTKPDVEGVIAADARFKGDREKLVNWYAVPTEAGFPHDVLLSQRTNVRWDAELRRSYATTIVVGLVALFLVLITVGFVKGLSLRDFVLALLPPVGACLLGIETVRSHRQHADGQHSLKQRIEAAWEKAVKNPRTVQKTDLRSIQDCIYRFRTLASPVPDWFYWRHRNRYEQETQLTLEKMWADAHPSAVTVPSSPKGSTSAASSARACGSSSGVSA